MNFNHLQAVNIRNNRTSVFFMSYHTRVTTSYDFYTAMEEARKLGADIKEVISKKDASVNFFPYRYTFL